MKQQFLSNRPRSGSDAQESTRSLLRHWIVPALLIAMVLLAACIQPMQSIEASTVVQKYLEAMVAKDLNSALAQVAADVTHTDTHAPPGLPSVTQGKAAYADYLKGSLSDANYRLEYANLQAEGERVTWTTKEWFDQNNVPPNFPLPIESHLTATVFQGKITTILLENDPAWLDKLYASIPPEIIDPASVTERWIKAFNAGDHDELQEYMAADIVLKMIQGRPDDPVAQGKEAVLTILQSRQTDHFSLETANLLSDGATVLGRYSGIGDDLRARNIGPEQGMIEARVENGQLKALTFTADEAFTQKYAAALEMKEDTETTAAIVIVQSYYTALNAAVNDDQQIDKAMSFIAPDAVFINPTGSYKTLAEIRDSLVMGAKDGLTFDLTNFREQNGRVVYDYEVKIGDELLDKGADGLTIVKAGKIVFDGTERTDPGTFE